MPRHLLDGILKTQPDFVPALLLRGKMYLTSEQAAKALPLLQMAVTLEPFDEKNRQHLAEAYRLLGDNRLALAQDEQGQRILDRKGEIVRLSRQVREQPWADDVRVRLGILTMNLHRWADARTWLRAALACNPNNRQARELLRLLDMRTRQQLIEPAGQTSASASAKREHGEK